MTDKAKRDDRAAACKGFRWMRRMMAAPGCHEDFPVGGTVVWVSSEYEYMDIWAESAGGEVQAWDIYFDRESWMRPDTDDPATLGCIEHGLLPELYGPNAALMRGPTGWGYGEGATSIIAVQPTKADALVAALEAAP